MDCKELINQLRKHEFERDPEIYCTALECGAFNLCDIAATAIETLLAEREAAINLLRKINWCSGCIHFRGLKGCADNAMSVCCNEDDHYQFCGPTPPNHK